MLIKDVSSIDLSKYKRFFVSGCSFTNYRWPTWADILRQEMPDAEYFNLGQTGAGNLFIAASLMEANARSKFNETDLVIPQWSTYFREDRYIEKEWITPGNIFTQKNTYNDDFIKAFACVRGYLIRDLALITATKYTLEALPCDSVMLCSILFNGELPDDIRNDDVAALYAETISALQTPMAELLRPTEMHKCPFPWGVRVRYINDTNPKKPYKEDDYHPGPLSYYEYLQKLKFNLSDASLSYVNEVEAMIDKIPTLSGFRCHWPEYIAPRL